MMLHQDYPDDLVLGARESHAMKEFAEVEFHSKDTDIQWKESGVNGGWIIR